MRILPRISRTLCVACIWATFGMTPARGGPASTTPSPVAAQAQKTVGQSFSPDKARAMAERAISGTVSLARTIEQNQAAINKLTTSIHQLGDDLRRLRAEKLQALLEIRQGLVCTTCRRTISEL